MGLARRHPALVWLWSHTSAVGTRRLQLLSYTAYADSQNYRRVFLFAGVWARTSEPTWGGEESAEILHRVLTHPIPMPPGRR